MGNTSSMLWTLLEQDLGKSNAILPDSYCRLIRRLLPITLQELELLDRTMHALNEYIEDISGHSVHNSLKRSQITPDLLPPLLIKKAKLELRVKRLRMALAPHKYLPSQLWSDIIILIIGEFAHPFKLLSTNSHNPLRVLLAVCGRWRDIILDNQTLWREIEISRRIYGFENVGLSWFVRQLSDGGFSTDAARSARLPVSNGPTALPPYRFSPSLGHTRDILQRMEKSNDPLPETDRQSIYCARASLEHRLDIITGIELAQRRFDRHLPESNLPAITPYLHQERNWIMQNLRRFRIALAPQKNLPSELWSLIFQYAYYSFGTSIMLPPGDFAKPPWNIYHVCARWRSIVLAHPTIWEGIIIRNWGSKTLQNIVLAGRFISRCKTLLLYRTKDPEPRHQRCLTELLLPYGHTLVGLWLGDFDLLALVPLFQSPPGSLNNLESFCVQTAVDVHDEGQFCTFPNITFLRDARKLSTLAFSTLSYPPLFNDQTHHLSWSSLVDLYMESNLTTSLATILHTLRSCESLLNCELICDLDEPTGPSLPPLYTTRLPFLSTLTIGGSNLVAQPLGALSLPSLKGISLFCDVSREDRLAEPWRPCQLPLMSLIQNSNCSIVSFGSDFCMLSEDIEELLESMPELQIFEAARSDFDVRLLVNREELIPEVRTFKIRYTVMESLFDLLDSRQPTVDELDYVHGLSDVWAWYIGDDVDQRRAERLRLRIREFDDVVKIKIFCTKDIL